MCRCECTQTHMQTGTYMCTYSHSHTHTHTQPGHSSKNYRSNGSWHSSAEQTHWFLLSRSAKKLVFRNCCQATSQAQAKLESCNRKLMIKRIRRTAWELSSSRDIIICQGLPRWLSGKESTCQYRTWRFNPWVGKMPWRRKWQPTLFLPGESHGQKSPVGYSPWGHKDGDVTVEVNSNSSNMPMSTHFTLGGLLSPSYSQRDWDSIPTDHRASKGQRQSSNTHLLGPSLLLSRIIQTPLPTHTLLMSILFWQIDSLEFF